MDARGLLFNFFLKKSKVLAMGWLSANGRSEPARRKELVGYAREGICAGLGLR